MQVAQAVVGSGSDTNPSMVMSVRLEKPFTVLSVVIVVAFLLQSFKASQTWNIYLVIAESLPCEGSSSSGYLGS